MSIPPLVCSTPPPPDQCEDDKDEDFDLQYRLSQDEDEENDSYNYGNFSSYTDYCEGMPISDDTKSIKPDIENCTVNVDDNKICGEPSNGLNASVIEIVTPKCEDVAVEDLNLKIEQENILSDQLVSNALHNVDSDTYGISCIVDHLDSPNKNNLALNNIDDDESSDEKSISEINEIPLDNTETQEVKCENSTETQGINETISEESTEPQVVQGNIPSDKEDSEMKTTITDDFDDFEDFKFTPTTISKDEVIGDFEDPWNNNETENFSFGEFKANFENNSDNLESSEEAPVKEDQDTNTNVITDFERNNENVDLDDDDDFGDFDDFKSSAKQELEDKSVMETQLPHHVAVLTFQCPDNEAQIIESINNILLNIFTDDIPNCQSEFDKTLDSMLTETWHHLKEVDERQPYMVHWNNTLGQKSLLKALCIDSRNILFGPKWNYFTPKYATNLSVAPLQPQKPAAAPNTSSSEASSEKTASKETTWTDPFTSDGQEYTYAEALLLDLEHLMATLDQMAHKHSTLKISELLSNASAMDKEKPNKEARPSNLDVFENEISVTNIDKIHSSTLSVQPLRHINLPDTHIFTPTDSETPRSKTIHYDNGPPVLLPQPIIESSHNINLDKPAPQHADTQNNDEYWEFQDFKGVTNHMDPLPNNSTRKLDEKVDFKPSLNNSSKNSGITYQTQLLQPVKIEPIMPTLNWPDPGEVKETFDDFSDFISNSNSNWNESQDAAPKNVLSASQTNQTAIPNSVEDEFETFQTGPISTANLAHHVQSEAGTFENFEPVSGLQKQIDNMSFKSNEILPSYQNIAMESNSNPKSNAINFLTKQSPTTHNNILQPINSLRAQQGGQILQPLSLESYSQINWPKPGIDLQNLSSFNPLESLQSLKSDVASSGPSKVASPIHNKVSAIQNEVSDDDIWGDFVSSKPKQHAPKKPPIFADDDEWTDFVSSPSLSQNSLNTISFNVQSNSTIQKSSNLNSASKSSQNISLDIPTLNYITPKSTNRGAYIDKHFQNL